MGCDIHCYVEYRRKDFNPDHPQWTSFGGRINPGRCYDVFAKLASVRSYGYGQGLKPKGLPDNLGWRANDDSCLFIVPDRDGDAGEGLVFASRAARWVQDKTCAYVMHGDKPVMVTHPDFHSHSWVTSTELETAIVGYPGLEGYRALIAVLRSFEEQGYDSRLVFWFDN